MKHILLVLSVLVTSLSLTSLHAQVNSDDFAAEPDKTMAASHQSFLKGDTDKAAAQIHKAAAYVKKESGEVTSSAKAGLQKAGDALDKLGDDVKSGTVKSADELKKTFASVDHALAEGWHKTAEQAKASGQDAGDALRKAASALDGAAKWSGTKLNQGAQA